MKISIGCKAQVDQMWGPVDFNDGAGVVVRRHEDDPALLSVAENDRISDIAAGDFFQKGRQDRNVQAVPEVRLHDMHRLDNR